MAKAITFLLLSDTRSGTMMLTDALDERPYIKFYNLYASNPDNPEVHYSNWKTFQIIEEGGITHRGTTMHRVGQGWFKQLSPLSFEEFWPSVNERHDYQICLHRENQLRRYISQKVGVILRSYHVHEKRKKNPGPIFIHMQEFMEFIGTTQLLQKQIDKYFPDRLVVTYEELDTEWDNTLLRIQKHLRLPQTQVQPVTVKQETRPLREAIENYNEIYTYLEHRGLGKWFDE